MLNAAIVRSLPVPSPAQCNAFIEHLVTVHSWYKHLSLIHGGAFVVFLAPDAGENYPSQHPRLPTENTVDGYRRAFGHLDYTYRINPDARFRRDGPSAPDLDPEIANTGTFTLYPYVSHQVYWSVHEDDIARLRDGAAHPNADQILAAYDADHRMNESWQQLSDSEREFIIGTDDDSNDASLPQFAQRHLSLATTCRDHYLKLHKPEVLKIRHCVDAVLKWLAKS